MRDSYWSWQHAIKVWITLILIVVLMIALMKSCPASVPDPDRDYRITCSNKANSATDFAQCVRMTRR